MLQHVFFSRKKVPNGLAPLRDHRAVRHGIRPHVAGNLDTNNTNNTYASYASGRSREDRTLRFRLTAVNSRHPICHRISKLRVRFVNPFFSPSNSCIHIPFVKATDAHWSLWSPQKVTRFDSLKFTQETELSEIMKPWAWYCSDCSSCPTCLQDAKMPRMWMKGSFKKIRNKTKQKKKYNILLIYIDLLQISTRFNPATLETQACQSCSTSSKLRPQVSGTMWYTAKAPAQFTAAKAVKSGDSPRFRTNGKSCISRAFDKNEKKTWKHQHYLHYLHYFLLMEWYWIFGFRGEMLCI